MSRWMRDAVERCMYAGHEWLAKDDPDVCADCLEWAMASAYRAGQEAALVEAAKKCDERMNLIVKSVYAVVRARGLANCRSRKMKPLHALQISER